MSTGSRYFNQFQYTLEKDTTTLEGSFTVDGYGEVTAFQGGGISSVEAVAATTGRYNITLQQGFSYLFEVSAQVVDTTISSVAAVQLLMDPATLQDVIKTANPVLVIQCVNYAGSAADPASTALVRFKVVARRSSVGPFDTLHT